MTVSLIDLRGMISNVAIENQEHNKVIAIIDRLIGRYGMLARIDVDMFIRLVYRRPR